MAKGNGPNKKKTYSMNSQSPAFQSERVNIGTECGLRIKARRTSPHNSDDFQPAIVFGNGLCSSNMALRRTAIHFAAEEGRTNYTYDDLRIRRGRNDPLALRTDVMGAVVARALESSDQVTLEGWSTGGIAAVELALAALRRNEGERIAAVVLCAPAGTFEENLGSLAIRSLRGSNKINSKSGAYMSRVFLNNPAYLFRDLRLTVTELNQIAAADIRDGIVEISEAGIPVVVIGLENDQTYPLDRIAKGLATAGLEELLHVIPGEHLSFGIDPAVMEKVAGITRQLEAGILPSDNDNLPEKPFRELVAV